MRINKRLKEKKKFKIGFTCGVFDLCHTGHMLMFKEAKEQCDYLIVGLQEDPSVERPEKSKPIQSIEERRILLEGIRYIDEIKIYQTETELLEILKNLSQKKTLRIIGEDWRNKYFTGYDLPIAVYYNSRNHSYSSTELRNRIKTQ